MNRKLWIFGSLLCLVVLTGALFTTTRGAARAAPQSTTKGSVTPVSISSTRLRALVGKTLGQDAVDHMKHLVSAPLSTHATTTEEKFTGATTTSQVQAKTTEHVATSKNEAGYLVNAEGASWVHGAVGFFNVSEPAEAPGGQIMVTGIGVLNSDLSDQIIVGVNQTYLTAFVALGPFSEIVFHVNDTDQMDTEIYLDGDNWLVFIQDLTTGDAFAQEYVYPTSMVKAAWLSGSGAFALTSTPTMKPIHFTRAHWYSNWAAWQPIASSAETSYTAYSIPTPQGKTILSTSFLDYDGGTSFGITVWPS